MRFQFSLWSLVILCAPIGITVLLLRDPVPINIALLPLVWIFGVAVIVRPGAFIPQKRTSYWIGAASVVLGCLSCGGSVLFLLAHSMDPIARPAPLLPFTLLGGLFAAIEGLLVLLGTEERGR